MQIIRRRRTRTGACQPDPRPRAPSDERVSWVSHCFALTRVGVPHVRRSRLATVRGRSHPIPWARMGWQTLCAWRLSLRKRTPSYPLGKGMLYRFPCGAILPQWMGFIPQTAPPLPVVTGGFVEIVTLLLSDRGGSACWAGPRYSAGERLSAEGPHAAPWGGVSRF